MQCTQDARFNIKEMAWENKNLKIDRQRMMLKDLVTDVNNEDIGWNIV